MTHYRQGKAQGENGRRIAVLRVCTPPDLPVARLDGAAARTHLQPHITEQDTLPRPRKSLTHRAALCQ